MGPMPLAPQDPSDFSPNVWFRIKRSQAKGQAGKQDKGETIPGLCFRTHFVSGLIVLLLFNGVRTITFFEVNDPHTPKITFAVTCGGVIGIQCSDEVVVCGG